MWCPGRENIHKKCNCQLSVLKIRYFNKVHSVLLNLARQCLLSLLQIVWIELCFQFMVIILSAACLEQFCMISSVKREKAFDKMSLVLSCVAGREYCSVHVHTFPERIFLFLSAISHLAVPLLWRLVYSASPPWNYFFFKFWHQSSPPTSPQPWINPNPLPSYSFLFLLITSIDSWWTLEAFDGSWEGSLRTDGRGRAPQIRGSNATI